MKETDDKGPEKVFELLSLSRKGQDVTVRDDQYEFHSLLDSVKLCRKRGSRFRLIDSGKFDRFQLEWITEAGADFYTSDEVRRNAQELEFINEACKKGAAVMVYFHHGILELEEGNDSLAFSGLLDLGRSGIYIHLTNKERGRDFSLLNQLAYNCRRGGSWLVYYHHGSLEAYLVELGRNGAWIHISDQSIQGEEDSVLLQDIIKSLRSAGTNLVLYLEKELDFSLLHDIVKADAFVLFTSSLFDYRSPMKALERESRKKKLDFRTYYLYPTFLP